MNQKIKKETLNTIETLEERINAVKNKRNIIKKIIHRKKRELKRGKLSSTEKRKFELNIKELENYLEIITDSKNEVQTRLDNENNKLSNKFKIIENTVKQTLLTFTTLLKMMRLIGVNLLLKPKTIKPYTKTSQFSML